MHISIIVTLMISQRPLRAGGQVFDVIGMWTSPPRGRYTLQPNAMIQWSRTISTARWWLRFLPWVSFFRPWWRRVGTAALVPPSGVDRWTNWSPGFWPSEARHLFQGGGRVTPHRSSATLIQRSWFDHGTFTKWIDADGRELLTTSGSRAHCVVPDGSPRIHLSRYESEISYLTLSVFTFWEKWDAISREHMGFLVILICQSSTSHQ